VFLESFIEEEVSRMLQGCLMIFEGVSRVFQGFQKVSCCMALIAASRAEGGLVLCMKNRSHSFQGLCTKWITGISCHSLSSLARVLMISIS